MNQDQTPFDLAIVGSGIVGLATGYQYLQQHPKSRIAIFEKESEIASHQSGRNSGVIHSGIYYTPGSSKANNCKSGRELLIEFCAKESIPYEMCGKVIVANSPEEIDTLKSIYERGQQNEIQCQWIDEAELKELEPHCKGVAAIHVMDSGIVDYKTVCQKLKEILLQSNSQFLFSTEIHSMRSNGNSNVVLQSRNRKWIAKKVVTCAGLQSDRISQQKKSKIIPFRGEYYELTNSAKHLCKNLIYPVPDKAFPFLGVHLTRTIDGKIECGPNAVFSFSREGYSKFAFNIKDALDSLKSNGFPTMAGKYWRMGLNEYWRSFSKRAFLRSLQKLVPEIQKEHLVAGKSGIRAQLLDADGSLVDDFRFQIEPNIIHVINAPSPAATSSLSLGLQIVEKIEEQTITNEKVIQ